MHGDDRSIRCTIKLRAGVVRDSVSVTSGVMHLCYVSWYSSGADVLGSADGALRFQRTGTRGPGRPAHQVLNGKLIVISVI